MGARPEIRPSHFHLECATCDWIGRVRTGRNRFPPSSIVNVSSGVGLLTENANPAHSYHPMFGPIYPASKTALNAITLAMAIDANTGSALHNQAGDEPRYPASLTKMMTLYLIFEALDKGRIHLDTQLPVSERAASQSPTKLDLSAGETVAVRDVILGLVTRSANDAAVVSRAGPLAASMRRISAKDFAHNSAFQVLRGMMLRSRFSRTLRASEASRNRPLRSSSTTAPI